MIEWPEPLLATKILETLQQYERKMPWFEIATSVGAVTVD
jgi:hypothetical protein